MACRFIYPFHTYDGSEEEGHEREAGEEGRINGDMNTGIDKRKFWEPTCHLTWG
jgi:hypothetical protein